MRLAPASIHPLSSLPDSPRLQSLYLQHALIDTMDPAVSGKSCSQPSLLSARTAQHMRAHCSIWKLVQPFWYPGPVLGSSSDLHQEQQQGCLKGQHPPRTQGGTPVFERQRPLSSSSSVTPWSDSDPELTCPVTSRLLRLDVNVFLYSLTWPAVFAAKCF